jgi:Metallo-beta-lactamase superfamily
MKKIVVRTLLVLLVVAAGIAIYGYQQTTRIDSERVTDDVSVLFGMGGNVGVLRTERGSVIVDTMTFRMQGERIREEAERLTGREAAVVLNTHYHGDHTHGNPGFPAGTRVVSTTRTRELLDAFDASYWSGAAAETLPNETFDATQEISLGGKTVRASVAATRAATSSCSSSKTAFSISVICSSTTAIRASTSKPAAASSSGSARSTACWRWTATTA